MKDGECNDAELIALAAVLNIQGIAATSSLKALGHTQVDPLQSPAYATIVKQLVKRGVLQSDDVFATEHSYMPPRDGP